MSIIDIQKKVLWYVLSVYVVIACFTIFYYDGTAGTGDTITHFLFAKYAFQYPVFYFDHWGKPVFTLLASPFAQFGFTGIKIFNAIITLFTLYFTYQCAILLNIKQPVLPIIFCILMPSYYILTFSGLTEPLFALFVSVGVYFILREKYALSVIWVSFMPFVRSEGLIIILAFACFLIIKKKMEMVALVHYRTYSIWHSRSYFS
jgi:Gpi18-like mannosyltransferase